MTRPINLAAERAARRQDYDGTACPACGCVWFDLVGVLEAGQVTGYLWPPKCRDCGVPLEESR